jgi:hypothetical protein
MARKVILGTLLVGLIGILVAGAVIRTVSKTENVAEARGPQGRGQVANSEPGAVVTGQSGQGGNGRYAGELDRQYLNNEPVEMELGLYEGIVVESAESGGDLVIATDDGQEITVGTGPGYLSDQGFVLDPGERVQVEGYWEDGELKAATLTNMSDGQAITLRDQLGRPAWAGGGRQAVGQGAVAGEQGDSLVKGANTQPGLATAPGDGTATGLAEVEEWVTFEGTVVSVDESAMVVQTYEGQEIVLEGRTWSFSQEQGLVAAVGDSVTLKGFYEDGEVEIGAIENQASGQFVQIREDEGRPLWAGRGRRGTW